MSDQAARDCISFSLLRPSGAGCVLMSDEAIEYLAQFVKEYLLLAVATIIISIHGCGYPIECVTLLAQRHITPRVTIVQL